MSLSHMYSLSELYDIAVILWLPRSEVLYVFTTFRFINVFENARPVLAKKASPVDLLIVDLILISITPFFFIVSTRLLTFTAIRTSPWSSKPYTYISSELSVVSPTVLKLARRTLSLLLMLNHNTATPSSSQTAL